MAESKSKADSELSLRLIRQDSLESISTVCDRLTTHITDHNIRNDIENGDPQHHIDIDGFASFSGWRKWIWPIHNHELSRVIPLNLMMFCGLFSYTTFEDLKDSLILCEPIQTALTLQWCQIIVVLPLSFVGLLVIFRLASAVPRTMVFISIVIFFMCYFIVHVTLLHPNRDVLHVHLLPLLRNIEESLDQNMKTQNRLIMPIIGVIIYPINTLFYSMAELWATISIQILLSFFLFVSSMCAFVVWGFINDITPKSAAKRYYTVLGLVAQLGPISAAAVVSAIMQQNNDFHFSYVLVVLCTNFIMLLMIVIYLFVKYYLIKTDKFSKSSSKQQTTENADGDGDDFPKNTINNTRKLKHAESKVGEVEMYQFVTNSSKQLATASGECSPNQKNKTPSFRSSRSSLSSISSNMVLKATSEGVVMPIEMVSINQQPTVENINNTNDNLNILETKTTNHGQDKRSQTKLTNFTVSEPTSEKTDTDKSTKVSMLTSLKFVFTNKYVLAINGILFANSWMTQIFDHSLRDIVNLYYEGDQSQYSSYKSGISSGSAIVTLIAMVLCGHNFLRLFGWKWTSLLTPLTFTLGLVAFYVYSVLTTQYIIDNNIDAVDTSSSQSQQFSPVNPECKILAMIGFLTMVFGKGFKYATSDPTKEMTYLYLDSDQKYQAKIAVELLGTRFGKVASALFNILVVGLLCDRAFMNQAEWLSFGSSFIGGIIWIVSINYLAKEMKKKSDNAN